MGRSISLLIAFVMTLFLVSRGEAAARAIQNDSGKPVQVMVITGGAGQAVGGLYVLGGQTMVFDDAGQAPMHGAGYYEAANGESYLCVSEAGFARARFEQQNCGVRVDRIEWNDDGTLKSIAGLRPGLELSEKTIAIPSDVSNPRVEMGNVYVKLAGYGDAEYFIKFRFGHVIAIGQRQATAPATAPSGYRKLDMMSD